MSGVVPPLETAVVEGDTETVVTVGATTLTVALPVWPSLVALMVTGPPTATAVTSPPDTVATALFDDDQMIERPVSMLPAASRVVAESCTTAPGVSDGDVGETLTLATGGGITVTVADPSCPSLDATIVTGPPMLTAVTSPVDDTVATALLVDDQVTVRFVRLLPWASRVVAVSCAVWPTVMDDEGGETTTEATGGGGSVPPPQATITVRQATSVARRTRCRARPRTSFRGGSGRSVGVWGWCTTFMELP